MTNYVPSSSKVIHYTYADLSARQIPRPVHIVQYDDGVPILAVSLYNDGQVYTLPDAANANIRLGKNDGTFVYNPALGCNSAKQIVYFEITQQMAVIAGNTELIIEIEIGGKVASTSSIGIIIDSNPVKQASIESTTEFKTGQIFAQEAINSAAAALASQKAAKTSETNAANSKNAAANSEQQAKAAYQEILAADIGKLESSLSRNHAVFQPVYDSSGNNLIDSSGNNVESRVLFVEAAEYQKALQRISVLESEKRNFAQRDIVNSKITEMQNQYDSLVESIVKTNTIQQVLMDSEGQELRDYSGRAIEGVVVLAVGQEIENIQSRIISLEAVIKALLLEAPINRISVLEKCALLDNSY